MLRSLLIYSGVFHGVVSVAEASESCVPRGELCDIAKRAPRCHTHCIVITATPSRREQFWSGPLREVMRQPFCQPLHIRRSQVEPIGANIKQGQHWSNAIYDQASWPDPTIVNIREPLGVDFGPLQCFCDLLVCRFLMTGERSQYEPKVLDEILTVENVLGRGYETLVRHPQVVPYGHDIARQPLCI